MERESRLVGSDMQPGFGSESFIGLICGNWHIDMQINISLVFASLFFTSLFGTHWKDIGSACLHIVYVKAFHWHHVHLRTENEYVITFPLFTKIPRQDNNLDCAFRPKFAYTLCAYKPKLAKTLCTNKVFQRYYLIISLAVLPLLFSTFPNLISVKTLVWKICQNIGMKILVHGNW